jgi:hypothetical protein
MKFSILILALCILSVNCGYNNYRHRGFHILNDDNNNGHLNVNQHYRNHNNYGSMVPSESNVDMLNKEDSSSIPSESTGQQQQQQQPQEQDEDQEEDSNDSSEN